MFTSKVNLLDGLPLIQIEPQDVLFITVRESSVEIGTATKTKTLPLTQAGMTNPIASGDLSSFPNLKQIKFTFPNVTTTNEQWRKLIKESYVTDKSGITFSLVTDICYYSEISDNILTKPNVPTQQPTQLNKATLEPSISLESKASEEEEYIEDSDEEYEEDDEEYEEDDEEYEEDEYEEGEDEEYEEEDEECEEEDVEGNYEDNDGSSECVPNSQVVNEMNEETEELMAFAEEVTSTILETYNKIYPSCYVQRPYGILTTRGVIAYSAELNKLCILTSGLNSFIINAYAKYVKADGTVKQLDNMNIAEAIGNKGLLYNYMPMLQAEIAFGIKKTSDGKIEIVTKWGDYTDYLYNRIKFVVFNLLKTRNSTFDVEFQTQIVNMFTNTAILIEYDKRKAMHLLYKQTNVNVDLAKYLVDNAPTLFAKEGEVISNPKGRDGFNRLLYAFNPENYHKEILFAYKMYQQVIASGSTPSAKDLIVGKTLDGSDMRLDLENRQNIIGAIMAGPRSGKGVLTLSVLAGLMAHEKDNKTIPFLYCDGKPEMAATMWEIERELQSKGIDAKILAIDGLNRCTEHGVGPNRGNVIVNGRSMYDFGRNLPEGITLKSVSVIPYLKLMQLFSAMAKSSIDTIPPYTGRFARVMLILDETIAIKGAYNKFCGSLHTFLKTNKPRAKDEPSEEYAYAHHLATVLTHMEDSSLLLNGQMTNDFVGTLVSEGPRKGFGVIQIGQFTTPGLWDGFQPKAWDKNPFGFLMKNASWRILGKNSGQSNDYGLAELKAEGMTLIGKLEKGEPPDTEKGQLGYFVYLNGATKDANLQKVFKSYLALNENDYNIQEPSRSGIFTAQLLSNAPDDMTKAKIVKEDLLNTDGSIRTEVGFLGLAQMLMSDPTKLVERLTAGYNLVWEFMQANGLAERYSCVEDYLVDCSPESIFSVEELADGVNFDGEAPQMSQSPSTGEFNGSSFDLDGGMPEAISQSQGQSQCGMGDMPNIRNNPRPTPTGTPVTNHFASTTIETNSYTNTPLQTARPVVNKETTVRQLMGDKLYNLNKTYLEKIPSGITPQDSIRSKEILCHQPFQTVDVQRIEPLSEVLIPGFLNLEWITNKMCQSKRFSSLGRKLKQQGFYRKSVNRKETKTMLLSIGEAVGGLETITHLDVVNKRIMLNNMNFNYCGDISLDNFDVFQFTKLINLMIINTDVPLSLMKILNGLNCDSIDDLWGLFDNLEEVQCMGQAYKPDGQIADQSSLFETEEDLRAKYENSQAKYNEMTGNSSETSEKSDDNNNTEKDNSSIEESLENALQGLPSLEMPDDFKRSVILDKVNELCEKKYGRQLPITVGELPDIDYLDNKAITSYAVTLILQYLDTLK